MNKDLKKFLTPPKGFEEKTKTRFLATFDARFFGEHARPSRFIFIVKTFAATVAAAAIVLGGVSAYADVQNVPADSSLYPWKRVGETVRLALTPPAAKPQLVATLATRRANEITDLEGRHPTSSLLPALAGDLETDVEDSIAGAEHNGRGGSVTSTPAITATSTASTTVVATGTRFIRFRSDENGQNNDLRSVCGTLQRIFGSSSSLVGRTLSGESRAMDRFNDRCGNIEGMNSATSSVSASTTVPVVPTSAFPRLLRERHRGAGGARGGIDL